MMMGNHRTSCTFTMQQIGRWIVIPTFFATTLLSLADSVLCGFSL